MTQAYPPHTARPNLVTLQRTILGLATIPFLYQIYNVITMFLPDNDSANADAGVWILAILWILSSIIIWSTYLHIWRIERKSHHFNAAPQRAIWVVLFGLFLIGWDGLMLFGSALSRGRASLPILNIVEMIIEVLVVILAFVELNKVGTVKRNFAKEGGAVMRMEQGGVDGDYDGKIPVV